MTNVTDTRDVTAARDGRVPTRSELEARLGEPS
jgi:hypothetical protein